ncbi:hypothetical protein N6L24_12530 [Cognatishimia sp. SS12]|uniref:hypothetical protein n=1 Tax=Cognatishimia sp. SS12 TaxID=2979465 RepID=UPI0023307CD6|nr:hypothetical protein [Cognatishimia sp. SS12]MDC0739107.1 hypothetical protein [Cognatishimia sp. SS12]
MSFLRPEATAQLRRWREVLVGVATLFLGLYWALGSGILKWVGMALCLSALALIYTGVQRLRFRTGRDGPGIVTVDEGEISYYGPLSGGVAALSDVSLVMLDPTQTPPVWVLQQERHADIAIPVNAAGADALFDAFAALPGIRTEFMLQSLKSAPDHPVVIWAKSAPRLH